VRRSVGTLLGSARPSGGLARRDVVVTVPWSRGTPSRGPRCRLSGVRWPRRTRP